MDEKVTAVSTELQSAFPDAALEYQFSDEIHKFRLNFARHTHWLLISRETMEDAEVEALRDLLENYQVVRALKDAHFSKRILLTRKGIEDQPILR